MFGSGDTTASTSAEDGVARNESEDLDAADASDQVQNHQRD